MASLYTQIIITHTHTHTHIYIYIYIYINGTDNGYIQDSDRILCAHGNQQLRAFCCWYNFVSNSMASRLWHYCCEYTFTIRRIRTIQLSRCCWNHARPWHASEPVSFLAGLRTYQHPGIYSNSVHAYTIKCKQYLSSLIWSRRFLRAC